MSNYLQDALTRFVAMEQQCISGSDAVPRAYHVGNFPYWTNFIVNDDLETDSEEYDVRTYTFIARLHIDFLTAGFEGEIEDRMYGYWVTAEDFFNQRSAERPYLTSTAYPEALDGMHPIGMRLLNTRVVIVPQGGVGGGSQAASVMTLEFTFEVPFHIELD